MGTLVKKIVIQIDGEELRDCLFTNIVLDQQLLRPNELKFTLQEKGFESEHIADNRHELPKKLMGAKVELTLSATHYNGEEETETAFEGIIYNVGIRHGSNMLSELSIDVSARTPDFLLMDHPHCISYENDDLKTIISATLDPYNIPNKINPRTTDPIPYTVQYNESNYQFLTRLAQRYGEWMYCDGKKWIFGEIQKKDTKELDPRHDMISYHYQSALSHHTLKHAHHDYLKYENTIQSDQDVSELTSSGYHILTDKAFDKSAELFTKETFQHLQCSAPEDNDMDELEVSSKTQLWGEKMLQTVCAGSSHCADLTIGSVIIIKDHLFKDNDEYSELDHDELIITGITHYAEWDGNYFNSFTAYPAKSKFPPYFNSDLFPVAAVQRAKVMDNQDPEKLGRIRVQFIWQEEQDANLTTPWIRIAQPHGGGDKGFYFVPEIDEEVMVDFENANAEKPYIVGTLYHGKEQLPDTAWYSDSNDVKAIRTRGGHTIEIHDEGDDGFIRIYDYNKENYILTLSTDDKLIKLESTGNIELIAKSDIVIEAGGNVNIKAGSDITQKADSNISLEATSKMSLQSVNHEQKASASMKLDGGGTLEAKAGMVKIN